MNDQQKQDAFSRGTVRLLKAVASQASRQRPIDPVTPASVARAKADTAAERRRVEQAVPGLVITDEGAMLTRVKPFVIGCPQAPCRFAAVARTDGRAVAALCSHLVDAHMWKEAR